jgi:5-methylthioribose kinase
MEHVHDSRVQTEQKIASPIQGENKKTASSYRPLTEQTVVEYIRQLPMFHGMENLEAKEVGGGYVNLVFRLMEPNTGQSWIVKQALPYLKVIGKSRPLTLERARIESEALKKGAEFVPDLVPQVIHTDEIMALTVMEDLSSFTTLRNGWMEGNQYPLLAQHIGTFLARTLFFTSDLALPPFKKKEQVKRFINPEMCKFTEDLVLTDPFFPDRPHRFPEELHAAVEDLWKDEILKTAVAQLKKRFLTQAEALLHGDLQSSNILVTQKETKIIDPESACYGPMGFDMGRFISNRILNYLGLYGYSLDEGERSRRQKYLEQVMVETWGQFKSQFSDLWEKQGIEPFMKVERYREAYLQEIWMDVMGFAGCEVIRYTIGRVHVDDLDSITDPELQLKCKQEALHLGVDLIKNRASIQTPEELIGRLRKVCQGASTKYRANIDQVDAEYYKNHSSPQFAMAHELLEGYSFRKDAQVLDVGCGDGRITAEIAQHVPKGNVLGIDLSVNMIQFAQQSFPSSTYPNLTFSVSNAEDISYQEQFDVILSFNCLHWVHRIRETLVKLVKALRIEGHLMIFVVPKESWNEEQRIIEKRKWQSYSHLSAYHSMLTSDEYLQILESLGMKLLSQKQEERFDPFTDKEEQKAFTRGWLPFFAPIPTELREAFLEDVVKESSAESFKILMMKWQKV